MTKGRNDWENDSVEVHSGQPSSIRDMKKKRTGCSWSDADYNLLVALVRQFGEDWPRIARRIQHKNAKQCMQKFKNSQRSGKKGNWSKEEDELLVAWVSKNGSTKWTECSKFIMGRCGKQCRERWVNILNPDIKKGDWSDKEQELIFNKLPTFMTSWSLMAGALTGRTENSIKNYFYSSVRRLKSNLAVSAIRDVWVDRVSTVESVFQENLTLRSEIQKLNTLSRHICTYLLSPAATDEVFRDFLLSVIFGSDGEVTMPIKPPQPLQEVVKESTPKKIVNSSTHPSQSTEHRFLPSDSRLVVPQENNPTLNHQFPSTHPPSSLTSVLETMRRISETKNSLDMSTFVRFLETQLKSVEVVAGDSKVVLRLPTCLNCHNSCCGTKVVGI
jgi:hypothetical protein